MEAADTLSIEKLRRIHDILPRVPLRDVDRDQALFWTQSTDNSSLFSGLDGQAARQAQALVAARVRLRKGDTLYRAGAPFTRLYAVQTGSLKTVLATEEGEEQVSGYHMSGDALGLDGIGRDEYQCEAIALEYSEVYALSFDRLEKLARDCLAFQHNFYRYLSGEIARQNLHMLLLGTMRGEKRVATFLLELAQRYQARGYSSAEFILRMTRKEIGSFLGLKLETVSRLLARFDEQGFIRIQGRSVQLLDLAGLKQLAHTGWRWD